LRLPTIALAAAYIASSAVAEAAAPHNSTPEIDLVGHASVIDGDTIEIHGARIRLWGVDAPESDQLCRNGDSDPYQCGRTAAAALAALFTAVPRPVTCKPTGRDQYGRTVTVCVLGESGPDLGQWLVANGHALDWPQYSKGTYNAAQQEAQKAERGIWVGSFIEPWKYRACRRGNGRPANCSDGD
jgi:endonuclease YncB( thermonuclease family)